MSSLFDSFQPAHNPIGFGLADFIELFAAIMLAGFAIAWRPWIQSAGHWLGNRLWRSMLFLAVLPVALRLTLLPLHPVPLPNIYDEFGHLFVADTLRHWRFANPAHPLHQFFETFFTLQQPTYSSIYPIGQGLVLAIGQALFSIPWAGVLLSTAAFYGLCVWMLRGWVSPAWALAGGVLAVFEFGPLCQWMNSYWGGELGAAIGCLVFGALPRLVKLPRLQDQIALGTGLGLYVLLRPFESVFLYFSAALFLLSYLRTREQVKTFLMRTLPIVAIPVALALGITLLQNKSVTGNWTTLPYQLSQYQYGVPAALTFQRNPVPHADLTPQQELGYKSQLAFRADRPETLNSFFERLRYRVRFYRFFFLPPLYLAILAFLPALRQWRFAWVGVTLLVFALGINFFPAFQFHYLAAVTCLFVLVSVVGLQQFHRWRPEAARLLFFLCAAHFAFEFSLHLFESSELSAAMRPLDVWGGIDRVASDRRMQVNQQLSKIPGQVLLFVRYWPQHLFQDEWVYNEADIDAARIVWARDLGDAEDAKLRRYYPHRSVWLLEPDATIPKLESFPEPPPQSVTTPPPAPAVNKKLPGHPLIQLEDVPR